MHYAYHIGYCSYYLFNLLMVLSTKGGVIMFDFLIVTMVVYVLSSTGFLIHIARKEVSNETE